MTVSHARAGGFNIKYGHKSVRYSSLAQSVERMTVNHDVAGSSPAGGANKKADHKSGLFFCLFFVKLGLIDIMIAQLVALRHERKFVWRSKAELVAWFKPSRGSQTKSAFVRRRIFVCIIHYSLFIIHYSFPTSGF